MDNLWLIKEADGEVPCKTGEKIRTGTKIRLMHLNTGANLHSHNVRSPLSNQQEVTGYGEGGEGDRGDNWVILADGKRGGGSGYWEKDQTVYLRHADTEKYLGCAKDAQFNRQNCGHNCPMMNHLEIFGRSKSDAFTQWKAETGIFLSK